jgi:hypothetical protein
VRYRQALALSLALAACASQGTPPGGPPDAERPVLVRIVPDSSAVNVRVPAVLLRFDEVVSERSSATAGASGATGAAGSAGGFGAGGGSGGAATGLAGLLMLSPSDGRDEVVWRREALELRPRGGFRPNTAYRVTLLPGLADLRGNRITEPFSFVFSTGPAIPSGAISGVLFDWTSGKPALNARVDLFMASDTTFRWSTRTDSLGRFRIGELRAATYELRAWVDANNDRRISFREIFDSARVVLQDTASLELYAYGRDTLPPRLETVEWIDSTAIRIRLDRGIVASWDGRSAELVGADSMVIPLGGPFVPSAVYDSLARERAQALRDSLAAVADTTTRDTTTSDTVTVGTTGGKPVTREPVVTAPRPPDTVRVENTRPAPRGTPPGTRPANAASADPVSADSVHADSVDRPVFKRSVPVTQWTAPLAAPLAPGLYRFRIQDAPGLNGRSVKTERQLRVQAPPPPRDSTARRP